MEREELLRKIEAALASVTNPRFYETERGFQGEMLVALHAALPDRLLPPGTVIEQEYQKRLDRHGLAIRPDIIVHEPFDPLRHQSRDQGNIAVVELKVQASARKAGNDFESLCDMMDVLAYPLGVFINIGTAETHAARLPERARGRIVCFATEITADGIRIKREP